jgi:23S rRNA (cytosine1962-C5)-methyltransferase
MTLAPLRLNKNEDRRLRAGHVWVFSNEVDTKNTPLTQLEPGQPVLIEDAAGTRRLGLCESRMRSSARGWCRAIRNTR